MKSIYIIKFICTVFLILSIGVTTGCVSRDISDIEDKVSEIMSRPGGRIKPLPEIRPYEAYVYKSGSVEKVRNPFKLFYVVKKTKIKEETNVDNGLTEEMEREIGNRNREELEGFELDSLRMVGTLENANHDWAIILDPNGFAHRVAVGNYLGSNIGKVINIYEDKVDLREIVQDSSGRWEEREASLALKEK